MEDKDIKHLTWIYERLVHVHNENPNTDYMIRLKQILDGCNPNNTSEDCGHYFAATKNGFLPCEFCSKPHPTYPTTTVK